MSAYPSNSESVAQDQIKAFVERILRMREEAKAINDDIREIYAEAKGNGFDTKIMKHIIKLRRQDARERDEAKAALESAETELRNASGDDSPLRQAIKDHEGAVTALNAATSRVDELAAEVAALRTRVDGLNAAKLDCATLTEAREQIATLEAQEKAWKAHDDWKREDTRLHGVSERADSAVRLAKAEATMPVSKATVKTPDMAVNAPITLPQTEMGVTSP